MQFNTQIQYSINLIEHIWKKCVSINTVVNMYECASVDSLHNSYHCVKKKSIHAFDVHMLINMVDVIWHLKRMQTKDQTVCSWTILRNIKPCRSLDALRLCVNTCWLAVFRQTHVTIVTKTLTTRPKTKQKNVSYLFKCWNVFIRGVIYRLFTCKTVLFPLKLIQRKPFPG